MTEVISDFHEWFGHIWRRAVSTGHIKDEGISHQVSEVFSAQRSFLSDCEELYLCSANGTLLKIDKEYFLDRTSERNLTEDEWFPDDLKNHASEYFFLETDTFTVSLDYWNNTMGELLREHAISLWLDLSKVARVLVQFENCPLCLKDGEQQQIPDYIVDYLKLPNGFLGNQNRSGRPPLSKAREEFARLGYHKGDRSWEQMARYLERKTGEKPSPKTMRDWRKNKTRIIAPEDN